MHWLLRYCLIFVFCFAAGNDFAQSTVLGTNTANESSRTICSDASGNMFVGGATGDDAFITKLDDQSNIIWNKRIDLSVSEPFVNSLQLVGDTIFGCGYYSYAAVKDGSFFFKMNATTGVFYFIKSIAKYGNVVMDIRYANGKFFLTGGERISNHLYGKITAVSSQTGNTIWETPAFRYHISSQMNSLWTSLINSTEMVNGKMFVLGGVQTNMPNGSQTIKPFVLGITETGTVFMHKYLDFDANGANYQRIQGISIKYDSPDSLVMVLGHMDNYNLSIFDFTMLMKCDLQLNGGFAKSYSMDNPPSYVDPNTLTVTNDSYVMYGGGGSNIYYGMFVLKLDKQGDFVKCVALTKGPTGYEYPTVAFVNVQSEGFGNADFKNGKHYFPATEFHAVPYNNDVNTIVIDENLDFPLDCSELHPVITTTYVLTRTAVDCFVEEIAEPSVYSDLNTVYDLVFSDACTNKTHSFNEAAGCNGTTTVTSVPIGFSDPTFQWSNGSTDSVQTVTTNDTLIVRVTDTKCCYVIDTIVPQISSNTLFLTLPADTSICSTGIISYTIIPNVQANPSNVSYSWSDGTINPQLTATSGGIYWLDVTNSCGTVRDSIVIATSLLPTISGASSVQACLADFPIQYVPTVNNSISVYWENNSTTPNRSIDSAGTYTLTAVNSCGQTSFTVTVTEKPMPEIDWISSLDTCISVGHFVTLAPTFSNTNTVLWSNNATTNSIQVNQTGTYSVTASNTCGSESATTTITINYLPTLSVPSTLDTCFDIGIGFSYTAQGSPGNYSWSSGSQTATEVITQNGVYTVTLSNACGSVAQSMLVNRVSDISLTVGIDSILACEGSILPEALLIETNYEYEILNSDLEVQEGRISTTGWYYIRAFNKCGDAFDSVYIDLQEDQVFYIANSFTPNGDYINEYYTWVGENVVVSEFQVFNRWGEMVFDGSDPQGWNGIYKGLLCPNGVYTVRVVVANCAGIAEEKVGFVALVR